MTQTALPRLQLAASQWRAGCCVVQRPMGALARAGHALGEIQEGFQEGLAWSSTLKVPSVVSTPRTPGCPLLGHPTRPDLEEFPV